MGYSRGDTATFCLSEGLLQLSGLQQRGCYHSLGYSRGDATTLWVTAEGILPLSGLQHRGYFHCLSWVIAEGILPLSVFQRGCYHLFGYSRGDIVCLSENTHHVYLLYSICIHILQYIYIYILYIYIYTVYIYIYCRYTYIYTYISLHGLQECKFFFFA